MHYDDVIAALFTAPADPAFRPEPVRRGAGARRLRDAIEPLAMHSVWSRRTNEALAGCGLDFFSSYVGARAALLGTPAPAVVAATFAVFEPSMIIGPYEAARAACDRERLLATREEATVASLRVVLADVGEEEVRNVVAVLRRGLDAASPLGRPLFAGLAALAWPEDPLGALWRCCELLREHRGDGHVAVLVAEGLDPVEANIVTELWLGMDLGTYSATRGWGAEALEAGCARLADRGLLAAGALTIEGQDLRVRIEQATDRAERAVLHAIGPDLDGVVDRLADWSARCVAARTFPPDPFKRAAG
jgi:hypothetical protein